jgi:kynurenine formamidase
MKFIDLTHSFTDGMPVYPGDPESSLKQTAHLSTDGYNDHLLHTLMHVGTHIDAPLHMIEGGKMMDEIDPSIFFGKGVLLDARNKPIIDKTILDGLAVEPGSIILVFTGFENKYRSPAYYENYPGLTEDFAERLVDLKVKIVGMDILGPDQPPFLTHRILLGNEILIIENMANLEQLLGVKNFDIIALPAKLHADAAPVRVLAQIRDES